MPLLGFWKKDKGAAKGDDRIFSIPPPMPSPSSASQGQSDFLSSQNSAAQVPDFSTQRFPRSPTADAESPETTETLSDLDKPPKPPEFDISGPDFPSDDEVTGDIPALEVPAQGKPVHTDDLGGQPAEAPMELPSLEQPEQQVKTAAIPALSPFPQQAVEPEDLSELDENTLQPLDHEIYQAPQVEKPKQMPQEKKTRFKARPESVQLEPGPLFINMEGYKQILANIASMGGTVRNADARIAAMASDRSKEDALYMKFQTTVDQTERKLITIDETLFGGKQYGGE